MKNTTAMTTLAILLFSLSPLAGFAAEDGAALFTAKCKVCHGADGKKLAKADLSADAVQSKADAALVAFLTSNAKHKTKVPDEATAKALVAHLRTLKEKK